MSNILKDFFSVINLKTFIVIAAACAATLLCTNLGFHYNVPTDLIGIAIVFPIVFSINAASIEEKKLLSIIQFLKEVHYRFDMRTCTGLMRTQKKIAKA